MTAFPTARGRRTPIGKLLLERGVLSREELEAVIARDAERVAASRTRRARPRRLGEALIAEGYMGAELLEEILEEQRRERGERPAGRRGSGLARREEAAAGAAGPRERLADYLAYARRRGASEIFFYPGRPPAVRIADRLVPLEEPALGEERLASLIDDAFPPGERPALARGAAATRVVDGAGGRFRAVLSPAEQGIALALRPLDLEVDERRAERLPPEVARLADLRRGLVVIAGAHGAGRAAALARLVALMNERGRRHIITIERQVSYEHPSRLSLIAQREVGFHTRSFESALRAALREDPDVLIVGEIAEPEAIATALVAAETGHLVVCSLHAGDAAQALRRLIDVHGAAKRSLVRATVANVLRAVAVLDAVPGKDGERFVVADVVAGTPTVTRLVREDRLHLLGSAPAGPASGIVSRDDAIVKLYEAGRVSRPVALEHLADRGRIDDLFVAE
jgi:twitching motility protein PilT